MRGRPVRGLAIIVATDDAGRYRTALMLAAAAVAAGGTARLFLNERAVGLLSISALRDGELAAAGLPSLAELQDEALSLGVRCIACASGLTLMAIDPASLDPRIETGGMVGIVTSLGEDRLVIA